MSTMDQTTEHEEEGVKRRDFLFVAAGGFGVVAAAGAAWPLIDQMNPSADVLALSSIEVDLSPIEVGQAIKVKWRGKPVYIRRRTEAEIVAARQDDDAAMPDLQIDEERVKVGHDEWLVLIGVCTHLGCIPIDFQGDYGGWYCPCHGSHYDTSGRIRKGPAPKNLEIPEYTFIDNNRIRIG
jgi:ubiquinol-cytochrome c reductase iron-sulfur subunit